MKNLNWQGAVTLISVVLFSLSIMTYSGIAASAETLEPGTPLLLDGRQTGEVNSVYPEQSLLIIDDDAFVLDHVVRFNNASWSREQVLNRLQPGDKVEIEIADEVRGDSSEHKVIKSLTNK